MNSNVDMNKLEADMKSLWKETFMDSDDYINVVFDNYFSPENCFFIYDKDVLVSDMLCVPYTFGVNNGMYADVDEIDEFSINDNNLHSLELTSVNDLCLKFSYQCGLATKFNHRCRGLMTSIINKANRSLFENGYVLSVLIPSDEEKALYYDKFGYTGITYTNAERYDNSVADYRNIKLDYNESDSKVNLICNNVIIGKVYDLHKCLRFDYNNKSHAENEQIMWIYSCYRTLSNNICCCFVSHTINDFIAILHENFIGGGKILLMVDKCDKPLAMLFCFINEDGEATVQLLLSKSAKYSFILLQFLKSLLPDVTGLSVREYEMINSNQDEDDEDLKNVSLSAERISEIADLSDLKNQKEVLYEKEAKPYAMAKILNVAEILKFVAALHPHSEFSILINHDVFKENEGLYHVKNGKLVFQSKQVFSDYDYHEVVTSCKNTPGKYILTVPELAAILFRHEGRGQSDKPDMAIPRISLNVALMLD